MITISEEIELSEIICKIKSHFVEYLGEYSTQGVSDTSRLREDLGVDSLDCVEIAMWAEEEFGIEVTDDEIASVVTVKDLGILLGENPSHRN